MKLTEKQQQKISEYIEQSLNDAKLLTIKTDSGKEMYLVDLLSSCYTNKDGKKEIRNIVEQIYFDMDEWEI